MPSTGFIKIRIGLDINQLRTDLRRSERLLRNQARKFQTLGSQLTSAITIPFIAAGAAGIKLANDLDVNFNKIENLVGVTGSQLDEFRAGVSSLSTEVGKSQRELSEALFAVTSAGLRGSEGLQILERSAKASVIGLGNITEIARASSAVLNAYGKENISASRSVDILTAIVREGNLEAESLAPVIGRVIGLAAQMGVSFEEVGASIATFTRLGVNSEEAVTALRGTLANFLNPADQVRKRLEEIGQTTADIRNKIANDGLTNTLIYLIDAFKGNEEALGDLIPNIRALSGVLGTAGTQGETYREILNSINRSTGIVDQGFQRVSKSADLQFKRALVQLQNVGIELGNKLIPIVLKIVNVVTDLVTRFQNLSPALQESIVKFGLIAAAIGPVLSTIGFLQSALSSTIGLLLTLAPQVARAITLAFGPVGIAIAGITAAAVIITQNFDLVKLRILEVTNGIIGLYNESIVFRGAVESITAFFSTLWEIAKGLFNTFRELFSSVGSGIKAIVTGEFKKLPDIFEKASAELLLQNIETKNNILKIWEDALDNIVEPRELLKINKSDVDNFFAPIEQKFKELKKKFEDIFNFSGGGLGGSVTNIETPQSVQVSNTGPDIDKLLNNRTFSIALETPDLKPFINDLLILDQAYEINKQKAEELAAVITGGLQAAFVSIGVAIGNALANAKSFGDGVQAVGLTAVSAFADVLQQIGELIIKAGFAVEAMKRALATFSGVGAIAAGVALVGIAQFIKSSIASKLSAPPALAEGGLAFGPTFALVGDNKNASVDPEVISPLSKLKDILKDALKKLIKPLFDSAQISPLTFETAGISITQPEPVKSKNNKNASVDPEVISPKTEVINKLINQNSLSKPFSNITQTPVFNQIKEIIRDNINLIVKPLIDSPGISIPQSTDGSRFSIFQNIDFASGGNFGQSNPDVVSPFSLALSKLSFSDPTKVEIIGEVKDTQLTLLNRTGESKFRRLK